MAGTERFIKNNEATRVYRRTFDDLPSHVKGRAYYNTPLPSALEERGYYVDWTDPATNQSGSIAVEFIHDENTQEDSWYALYQSEGRKPWYTDTSRRITYNNVYGLGWWNINDTQHPDFVQTGPSSQSAPQLQQSTSQQSQPHEEFAAGALHHIATIHDTDP